MYGVTAEDLLKGLSVNQITATHRYHAGLYILTHKKSGKFFVGAGSNIYLLMRTTYSTLNNDKHECRPLQDAFNDDPNFTEVATLTGAPERAYELKQSILDQLRGTNLLLNTSPLAARVTGISITAEMKQAIKEAASKFPDINNVRKPTVYIKGQIYRSMQAAADALGMSLTAVHHRIHSRKYPDWKKISYKAFDDSKILYL